MSTLSCRGVSIIKIGIQSMLNMKIVKIDQDDLEEHVWHEADEEDNDGGGDEGDDDNGKDGANEYSQVHTIPLQQQPRKPDVMARLNQIDTTSSAYKVISRGM